MSLEFEILSPTDRPALLGFSAEDMRDYAAGVFDQMGFKVHTAATHEEFLDRFNRVQYELILLEETFAGVQPADNLALTTIQSMPMALRRHATILLMGGHFQTLNPMQAFQQSVHAVIDAADADKLMLIVQQVLSDNALFLTAYRDIQSRIAQGKK